MRDKDHSFPATEGLNILVAEDNELNRSMVSQMLKLLGCTTDMACNGQEVLERRFAGAAYDLVFMDCQMPVMNGMEATEAIRQREDGSGGPRVPIIALTANFLEPDRQRALAAGMDDFLAKPFRVEELRGIIEKWSGRVEPRAERMSDTPRPPSRAGEPDNPDPAVAETASPEPTTGRPGVILDDDALEGIRALQRPDQPDILTTVIQLYLTTTPKLLAELSHAVEQEDAEGVFMAAHKLKSSSAQLGATQVATLAAKLEAEARGGSTAEAPALLRSISHAHATAIKALRTMSNAPDQRRQE